MFCRLHNCCFDEIDCRMNGKNWATDFQSWKIVFSSTFRLFNTACFPDLIKTYSYSSTSASHSSRGSTGKERAAANNKVGDSCPPGWNDPPVYVEESLVVETFCLTDILLSGSKLSHPFVFSCWALSFLFLIRNRCCNYVLCSSAPNYQM